MASIPKLRVTSLDNIRTWNREDTSMNWFRLSLQRNDSFAFREHPRSTEYQCIHQELVPDMSGTVRSGARRCDTCGELIAKWEEPLTGLVVKCRRHDISVTYDGIVVATVRFKSIYERQKLLGLKFRQLPDDPSFFAVYATRAVQFDAERRKTRFIDRCAECGHFESVVGATPLYLSSNSQIGDKEFVRTNLEFGSDDEKSPVLLCGGMAANTLSRETLNGLDLIPVNEEAEESAQ